jgi:hypothetical protein
MRSFCRKMAILWTNRIIWWDEYDHFVVEYDHFIVAE